MEGCAECSKEKRPGATVPEAVCQDCDFGYQMDVNVNFIKLKSKRVSANKLNNVQRDNTVISNLKTVQIASRIIALIVTNSL